MAISRIVLALAGMGASLASPPLNDPPPVLRSAPTSFITADLTRELPPESIKEIRQQLKQYESDGSKAARAWLEIHSGRYEQAVRLARSIRQDSLLSEAARFIEASARRRWGSDFLARKKWDKATRECSFATALFSQVAEPAIPSLEAEARQGEMDARLCAARSLIQEQKPKKATPFLLALYPISSRLSRDDADFVSSHLAAHLRTNPPEELEKGSPADPSEPRMPRAGRKDQELLDLALKETKKGNPSKAFRAFAQLLESCPGSTHAPRALSYIQTKLKRLRAGAPIPRTEMALLKDLPPDHLSSVARVVWEDGHDPEAGELFRSILSAKPATKTAALSLFALARIEENLGDWSSAHKHYASIVSSHSSSVHYSRALFKMGWLSYLQGDLKQSRQWLGELVSQTSDPAQKSDAEYWLAKIDERRGDNDAARERKMTLFKISPLSFYSFLALGSPRFDASTQPPAIQPTSLSDALALSKAEMYLAAGMGRYVRDLLLMIDLDRNVDLAPSVAQLHVYAGDWISAFAAAGKAQIIANPDGSLPGWIPAVIFPTPFSEEVAKAAESSGIDAALIYAIMKQESAFHPSAESSAGAMGLMQLMPTTAASLAQNLNASVPDREDLKASAHNITLGSRYLANLLKKYSGNLLLVAAAYNAGESRSNQWAERWNRLAPDEFVEMIPFGETRNYVKAVVRNYVVYTRILENRELKKEDIVRIPKAQAPRS